MNEIQIKLAALPRDKEKISEYYATAWREIFGEELLYTRDATAKARRLLRRDAGNIAFGYLGEREAGIIMLDDSVYVYPGAGHISLLYLKPDFRRIGLGFGLVSYAAEKYKKEGKKHVSVRVAENNASAYAFYKKHGFYEVFRETEETVRQIVMLLDI